MTLPYVSGLTEPLGRVFQQYGISSYMKATNTLRQLLCSVYHISCEKQNWQTVYIGESERTLKDRFQGRKRASNTPSEVFRHRYSDK